ncbi:unnamed protein product [Medioppia subpectinata]|uniref:Nuclear receptor domain-containing protein n=1 Tax=Medioppia subpectinata TaxID=1979941 RepID=A0A7R9L3J2_9ACAR|nr:unnamed protein product [Medioppia subpectinata]CAG2114588.1 unnamed protein product [Medioppia subpectinata]
MYTFNFGVESCESCKAFFRRNALKNRGFVCKYGGNCEVDVTRRRFCRSCRLQKCFADYILTDEQKSQRKFFTKENREKRDDNNNNESQNILDFEGIEVFDDSLDFEGMEMFDNSYDFDHQMVSISRTINTYDKNLNDMEISRLGELLNAAELIRDPVSKITAEPKDLDVILATYGFKMDLELRRLPVMCKHLSAFSTICEEDKMRTIHLWLVSKDFFTKYGGEWDLDSIILDLLTAIALFNADRPNIIHKPTLSTNISRI